MEGEFVDQFDEAELAHTQLGEAALRLLAALGREPRFPDDPAKIEALLGGVAEGRPGEPMDFAVEPAAELPRYTGRFLTWVSPGPDGSLRLRQEGGGMRSVAVLLHPDGRLGEFESIAGFGVPDSQLTEQALRDREAIERLVEEQERNEVEIRREIDEDQRRFRTENLLEVRVAPPQAASGPVVSFVALYSTGVIVYYLTPRPPEEELETDYDDPWAEPLIAALEPAIELSDGLGTAYEEVGSSYFDENAPLLRASRSFVPAVPAAAGRLVVRFESAGVEIDLRPG